MDTANPDPAPPFAAPGLSILSPFSSSSHGPTSSPTNGLPANVMWNVSLGGPVTARPLTSPDGRRIFVPVNHTLLALQVRDLNTALTHKSTPEHEEDRESSQRVFAMSVLVGLSP